MSILVLSALQLFQCNNNFEETEKTNNAILA
jgi:hypothetical protein